jgi:hypothetical protein
MLPSQKLEGSTMRTLPSLMHLGKIFSLKSFSLILASDYTQKGKMKVGFIQKVKARDNKPKS